MPYATSIRDQLCPNTICPFYGRPLAGNVVVHSSRTRRLRCSSCGRTWVAHSRDPHYRLKVSWNTVERALTLLKNGLSVRRTATLLRLSPSTAQRWKRRFNPLFNP